MSADDMTDPARTAADEIADELARLGTARVGDARRMIDATPVGVPHRSGTELERGLVAHGVDADVARTAAHAATGGLSALLSSQLARHPGRAARSITGSVDELDETHVPQVERYLQRIARGQHDLRRLSGHARDLLAAVVELPREVVDAWVRSTASPSTSPAATPARSDSPASPHVVMPEADDPVSRLFLAPADPGDA